MTQWILLWLRRPGTRRRKAWGLALIGVCAAGSQAGDAQDDATPIKISLRAEKIDGDLADEAAATELAGDVHLHISNIPGRYTEFTMETERLSIALGPGEVSAPEGATFRTPGIEVWGDDLYFNYREQNFRAVDARSVFTQPVGDQELSIYANSQRIEAVGGDTSLYHTRITTCDAKHPHFAFKVRRLRAQPDKGKLTLYGGKAALYGTEIPLIRRISGHVEDGEIRTNILIPSYSSREGLYIPYDTTFSSPDAPIRLSLDGRLTQRHFVVGTLQAERREGSLRTWAALARREGRRDDINDHLIYNALPEIGAEWTAERGSTLAVARVTAGDYRDINTRTKVRNNASALTGRVDWDFLRSAPDSPTSLWFGAGARASIYSTGDTYRTVDARAGVSAPLWGDARGRLDLIHTVIGGRTPLEIDDVDIPTEARAAIDTPLGGPWSMALTGRYDIDRSDLRDYTAEVRFRHHCLTWSLNYRDVGSSIGIGVNLFGFGSSPAEPRRKQASRQAPLAPLLTPLPGSGRGETPAPDTSDAPETPEHPPTEFDQAEGTRERAPTTLGDPFSRRPPPSTRLAYAPTVH